MRNLFIVALMLTLPAVVSAQGLGRRTQMEVRPIFGAGTLQAEGCSAVVVEVENQTSADQRGALHVVVSDYRGTSTRSELPLDVPAGQSRRVVAPVFTGRTGSSVHVEFLREDGLRLARNRVATDYTPAQRSVVVFGDPPRLRGALLDLEIQESLPSGPRQVRFPIGVVSFDPATSDPLLPEGAGAWSTVRLLVANAHVLSRASQSQRRALEDWLRTGGQLLVFPRSDADLREAWVRELVGSIGTGGEPPLPSALVPAGGVRFGLRCSNDHRQEQFGCSRAMGSGRVFVASYDGTTPAAIEDGSPRLLIIALLSAAEAKPGLSFARGADDLTANHWQSAGSFGAMRVALDPNEGFRPALLLVTLVLIFYVVLIGPLNFSYVKKRNKPTLALLTTPLIASACVLLLVAVGYLGKGVTMRYRRIELVESVEGQSRAAARRYTGLFSTRPGAFDIPAGDANTLFRRIGGSGEGPTHRTEGGERRLVDFRAGLWETTFLREDRIVDLGGAINFERDELLLTAVVNESQQDLTGAILIDTSGAVYRVGDVASGSRAEIPRASEISVSRHFMVGPEFDGVEALVAITDGSPGDDEAGRLRALVHLLGDRFIPEAAPVLYARVPANHASIGGIFAAEFDERWVRIRPLVAGAPIEPAPGPIPDPYAYDEWSGPVPSDETVTDAAAGDAAAVDGAVSVSDAATSGQDGGVR